MRHINIPVFIPHLGCPNQCVFCNQHTISGVSDFDPDSVRDIIDEALSTVNAEDDVEIAFFGGSFTGIDRELMIYLLEIANSYVLRGSVRSIRCSTRPDYVDEEIVGILKKYNVCVVELGLQSVSDEVLEITKRNHSFSDEERACRLITEAGITLVGQMMIGLPGATIETELETARFIINAGAVAARVYPTIVFRDTELCSMSVCGSYTPLSLDEAVERTAKVVSLLRESDVKVIRVGLCSSDNLSAEDTYFAGPNHPALGELVENRIYYDRISDKLKEFSLDSESVVEIYIPRGALSKAVGQKKRNKFLLIESFGIKDAVFIESDVLSSEEILIVKRKENKCT
jgi:histone acetyltransferase (RNA polymerase elongator complex component)